MIALQAGKKYRKQIVINVIVVWLCICKGSRPVHIQFVFIMFPLLTVPSLQLPYMVFRLIILT